METIQNINEGALLKGTVKNIIDYGVFVDLGGIDGLLHISDISWGRITHPSEFFSVGDQIEVIVLKYDAEKERVTLGYKQKNPDPWTNIEEKFPEGKHITGKVVSITDYGAFIELEPGLAGLVHISEIDWLPRPKHPSKYLSIGETVEAVVLKVDKDERKLSLSIKQIKPSPWVLINHVTWQVKRNTNSFKATDYPEFLIKAGDVIGINIQSVVNAATVTPTNLNDEVVITAQASALFLANPTGTAVQGQSMLIRIKDNGTARAITYGTEYRAIGVTLPTTTVLNKTVYLGLVYNATDTKWDVIGVAQEA